MSHFSTLTKSATQKIIKAPDRKKHIPYTRIALFLCRPHVINVSHKNVSLLNLQIGCPIFREKRRQILLLHTLYIYIKRTAFDINIFIFHNLKQHKCSRNMMRFALAFAVALMIASVAGNEICTFQLDTCNPACLLMYSLNPSRGLRIQR